MTSISVIGSLVNLDIFSSASYYNVVYRCKKSHDTLATSYLSSRNKWGDVEKVKAISKRYADEKNLLHFSFVETENELSWNYVFLNKKSFLKWNDEVFYTGAFNSLKIEPDYAFTREERHIDQLPATKA